MKKSTIRGQPTCEWPFQVCDECDQIRGTRWNPGVLPQLMVLWLGVADSLPIFKESTLPLTYESHLRGAPWGQNTLTYFSESSLCVVRSLKGFELLEDIWVCRFFWCTPFWGWFKKKPTGKPLFWGNPYFETYPFEARSPQWGKPRIRKKGPFIGVGCRASAPAAERRQRSQE